MIEALLGMGEEALMEMLKDQAAQAMGPELAALGGSQAVEGMSGDIGGLLGQTQAPTAMSAAPQVTSAAPVTPAATQAPTGVMDTLKENVMSDINKSTYGQAYNTITNPNSTVKDYTSLGYKFAFSPEAEADNKALQNMPPISVPYGGRVTTTGGIPDLLKQYGYNPGLLQYLG